MTVDGVISECGCVTALVCYWSLMRKNMILFTWWFYLCYRPLCLCQEFAYFFLKLHRSSG